MRKVTHSVTELITDLPSGRLVSNSMTKLIAEMITCSSFAELSYVWTFTYSTQMFFSCS